MPEHSGYLRKRRVILPPRLKKPPTFSHDDFKVLIDSILEEKGAQGLEELKTIIDQYYENLTGSPLYKSLIQDRDRLLKLIEVTKLINTHHELDKLLEFIIDQLIKMTGAQRGFLILNESGDLAIKIARNFDKEGLQQTRDAISKTIVQTVIKTGKPIFSKDALNDKSIPASESILELELRSLLCVPFKIKDKIIGCLYLDNNLATDAFTQDQISLLEVFADQAAIAIENARLYESLQDVNKLLKRKIEDQYQELSKARDMLVNFTPKYSYENIVGRSRPIQEVFLILDKIIDQNIPVLIIGESGTGKELVARAVHFNSSRKDNKFVSQNCAAIPETLLESELFGYEKGAFTGATQSKPGLFELAHNGTLFLDEIADMSPEMQAKLLRAVEYGEIRRIGSHTAVKVNVRLISATNKNLADLIKEEKFREDLYYRLNVMTIKLPALRDRREDIPLLVDHFLDKIAKQENKPREKIDDLAMWYLQGYDWPGNIRELENELQRLCTMADDVITADLLKDEIKSQGIFKPATRITSTGNLKDIVKDAIEKLERSVIIEALNQTGWKKMETARILGVSRPTLDAKISQYNIERPTA